MDLFNPVKVFLWKMKGLQFIKKVLKYLKIIFRYDGDDQSAFHSVVGMVSSMVLLLFYIIKFTWLLVCFLVPSLNRQVHLVSVIFWGVAIILMLILIIIAWILKFKKTWMVNAVLIISLIVVSVTQFFESVPFSGTSFGLLIINIIIAFRCHAILRYWIALFSLITYTAFFVYNMIRSQVLQPEMVLIFTSRDLMDMSVSLYTGFIIICIFLFHFAFTNDIVDFVLQHLIHNSVKSVVKFDFDTHIISEVKNYEKRPFFSFGTLDNFSSVIRYIEESRALLPKVYRKRLRRGSSTKQVKGSGSGSEEEMVRTPQKRRLSEESAVMGNPIGNRGSGEFNNSLEHINSPKRGRKNSGGMEETDFERGMKRNYKISLSKSYATLVCLKIQNLFSEEQDSYESMLDIHARVMRIVEQNSDKFKGHVLSITEDEFFIGFNIYDDGEETADLDHGKGDTTPRKEKNSRHHNLAINCALSLQEAVNRLNTDYLSDFLSFITFGIGVCSGNLFYGLIGHKNNKVIRAFGPGKTSAGLITQYALKSKNTIVVADSVSINADMYKYQMLDKLMINAFDIGLVKVYSLLGRKKRIKKTQWQDLMMVEVEKDKYKELLDLWEEFEKICTDDEGIKAMLTKLEEKEFFKTSKLYYLVKKMEELQVSLAVMMKMNQEKRNILTEATTLYNLEN